MADSDADPFRKLVVPRLQQGGWNNEPHSIAEQRVITNGRIVPAGKKFVRRPPKRAEYLLRYTRDFALGVVEAKPSYKTAAAGLQQAKDYAEILGIKFASATNGQVFASQGRIYRTRGTIPRDPRPRPQRRMMKPACRLLTHERKNT